MEWWDWLMVAALASVTVITLRGVLTFDVNRWLENRHERAKERLQIICPHTLMEFDPEGSGKFHVKSLFFSPSGTLHYYCSRCGMETADPSTPERIRDHWGRNPQQWIAQEEKFIKAYDKYSGGA